MISENPAILSIDTSTYGCSVALHKGVELLSSFELLADKSSSAMLTTLVEQVCRVAEVALERLDAIAVAKGPGSYTGLRIGVSTAKGLCYALDKPLIAVNTLTALAAQLQPLATTQFLCPMLDARRMEVYLQVLDTRTLATVQDTSAEILHEDSLNHFLQQNTILFFGDGATKWQQLAANNPNARFAPQPVRPSAKTVGLLAVEKFKAQDFEDLATFEPYYLKEFMGTQPKKNALSAG